MPDKSTIRKARRDARQGKSASTQAGEFVHDEIRKIRRGQHGARNAKQAIAIGLSEARCAGVKIPEKRGGKVVTRSRRKTSSRRGPASRKRSRATLRALKREPRRTVSKRALSRQARSAARRRSPADRSRAARKAANTRRHHHRLAA